MNEDNHVCATSLTGTLSEIEASIEGALVEDATIDGYIDTNLRPRRFNISNESGTTIVIGD